METNIDKGGFPGGTELALSLIHGAGLALSIALLCVMAVSAAALRDPWLVMAASLWGAAAVFRFLFSVLGHALSRTRAAKTFRVMDHAGEYFFAAAVLAPLCLGPGRGLAGWLLFGLSWALAVYGILFSSIYFGRFRWLPLLSLVSFDWIVILLLPGLRAGSAAAFALSFSGALVYLIGCVFYPEEERASRHLLWHSFSTAAAVLLGLGAVLAIRAFP